ncbi:MAG: hypothetical protein ABIU05_10325 [Nitrospirales bacterium]
MVLYFVAVSLILFGHAKGLFLTPLFVVVGWELFSHFKSRLQLVFAMALLALHIGQNVFALKSAFQCSEVPRIDVLLKMSRLIRRRYFMTQAISLTRCIRAGRDLRDIWSNLDLGGLPACPAT